jgi:hypothetical protein
MLYANEMMASILHLAHNIDEEGNSLGAPAPDTSSHPILAFVAVDRGSGF